MDLHQLKTLFEATPGKYPYQLIRRHPAIFERILTHWDVPIEAEALFARLTSASASAGSKGVAADALLDLTNLREAYRRWRDERRPKAPPAIMRDLVAPMVPEILANLQPPSPEVLATMRKAFDLVQADDAAVASMLPKHGLTSNQRDMDGITALMMCAQRGSERAALALIRSGANPHIPDSLGNTALHWAVIHNKRRMAEMLLYFGANPNTPNAVGATPYALSAIKEDSALAQRLYEYGADISTQDQSGNTPLHKAVLSGSIENVWLLLQAGAPSSARNKAGVTPKEAADKNPEIRRIWDMHQVAVKQAAL